MHYSVLLLVDVHCVNYQYDGFTPIKSGECWLQMLV
jgi:hypothetical protein